MHKVGIIGSGSVGQTLAPPRVRRMWLLVSYGSLNQRVISGGDNLWTARSDRLDVGNTALTICLSSTIVASFMLWRLSEIPSVG